MPPRDAEAVWDTTPEDRTSRSIPAFMARFSLLPRRHSAAGGIGGAEYFPSWETRPGSANPGSRSPRRHALEHCADESLAREMGRTGTTANSIALGLIESVA